MAVIKHPKTKFFPTTKLDYHKENMKEVVFEIAKTVEPSNIQFFTILRGFERV